MNIQKTIKLYDTTPYETTFTATVLSCEECPDYKMEQTPQKQCAKDKTDSNQNNTPKIYRLVLNQTLFFPEEGGQSPDKGTINGMEVIDVQINNDIVEHYLAFYDHYEEVSLLLHLLQLLEL